jgi:hypothetical protein
MKEISAVCEDINHYPPQLSPEYGDRVHFPIFYNKNRTMNNVQKDSN